MGYCTVTRGPLPMFLGLMLSLGGAVSCQSGAGATPDADSTTAAPSLKSIPDDLRGAYHGGVNPRPPKPTGSPARVNAALERWQRSSKTTTAQLILQDEPYLAVHGHGTSKLVLIRTEPRSSAGRPLSDALVFRAQPVGSAEAPRQVTLTPPPMSGVVEIVIDWGTERGSHAGTLLRPASLNSEGIAARSTNYFKYADWRTSGAAAPAGADDHTAQLKRTLETLWKEARWRCLAGQNLTVRPGEPARFDAGRVVTPRRFLIICPDGGIAVRANASRPVILPPRGTVMHPAVEVTADLRGAELEIHRHEDDPARLIAAHAQDKPVTVTVLTLGNTRGDYGPLYPKERAIADVAAPFVMAAGVAVLVNAATGGGEAPPAGPGGSPCADCDGRGQIMAGGGGPFASAMVSCPKCFNGRVYP